MKKVIASLMAIAVMLLGGCSFEKDRGRNDDDNEIGVNNKSESSAGSYSEDDFEKTVVLDNEYCKLTVTGIEPDSEDYYGEKYYTIYFEALNKTSDKIIFVVDESYFNGVLCNSSESLGYTVFAGSTEEVRTSFSHSDLEEITKHGLTEFTDIELKMNIHKVVNYSSVDLANEIIHIYPLGKENASSYVRDNDNDITVVNNGSVEILAVDNYYTDELFVLDLYVCNNIEDRLTFKFSDKINGENVESDNYIMNYYLRGGKNRFISLSWKISDLEAMGISDVEEIDLWIVAESYNTRYICDSYIVNI